MKWISYKRDKPKGKFDTIMIGTGMGALTTAAILAKSGKKVLLLEKHYVAGGFTHVFTRNDYEWDVGLHYVGEVGDPKWSMRAIFDYITDGQLEWADMGEVYDVMLIGGKRYEFVKGREELTAKLKSYFPAPADQEAIDRYFEVLNRVRKGMITYFAEKSMPYWLSNMIGGWMRKNAIKYGGVTTLEILRELTDNQELIGVLTGQCGDYGLPPGQSSFMIHATVANHYTKGGFYPVGGSARIAETIAPVIEKAGGQILVNADVEEVIIEKGRAKGVRMTDGQEFFAKNIVSGAGVLNTWEKLVSVKNQNELGVLKELEKIKVKASVSHLCLYVGFRHTPDELQLPKHNYWIYPQGYDHDASFKAFSSPDKPFPLVYISFPSAKDPDFNRRFPGKSTLEIITLGPWEWFEQWEKMPWKKRGEAYDSLKENFSQRLLEHLYETLPQLRGKVDYYELSTPLSTEKFTSYASGEIYGLNHDPERFQQRFIRVFTPVKNLFLTGQDIVSCGIVGALMSGVITASTMMKRNYLSIIVNKARKEIAEKEKDR